MISSRNNQLETTSIAEWLVAKPEGWPYIANFKLHTMRGRNKGKGYGGKVKGGKGRRKR